MNKIIFLFSIISLTFSQTAYTQTAYDGFNDHIFAGYTNIGGKSGFEIQAESSTNEYLSFGYMFNYLINPSKNGLNSDFNDVGKTATFLDCFDTGFFARVHIGTFFESLNERIDPYAGVDLSLKSISGNVGLKYQLTNTIGFYARYSYSFSNSFYGLDFFNSSDSSYDDSIKDINYFGKQNTFAIGVSFSL